MEVLVAVMLMGIVFSAAFLVLTSTRSVTNRLVSNRLTTTPFSEFETFEHRFRLDLDQAQGRVAETDPPVFSLVSESGKVRVEWVTIDHDGLPIRCAYQQNKADESLDRLVAPLHQSPYPAWQTNQALSNLESVFIQVHDGTDWKTAWPVDKSESAILPHLVQLEIQRSGETTTRMIDALIPVSLNAQL